MSEELMDWDDALEEYGLKMADLLNEFMEATRPPDWDGPEPIAADIEDGKTILEDWSILVLSVK